MRLLERVLPQTVLSILLWPAAVIWNTTERHKRREVRADWYRFPPEWRPDRFLFSLTQNLRLTHSRFIYLWVECTIKKRWLKHCRLRGQVDLDKFRHSPRPIIFVTLHFGPLQVLPVWLRAHGIPVTMLVGPAEPRQCLRERFSKRVVGAEIPLLLPVTEIGRVPEFIKPHRRLGVSIDVERGKQVVVRQGNYSFRLATGALRLAALSGGEVIPCLITFERGAWNVGLHFGAPVPEEYLGPTPDLNAAASHIMGEFLPIITSHPHLISPRLLKAMSCSEVGTSEAVV